MSARGKRRSTPNPLEKKIPENPKYKHVRATVDTGASLSKYMEKMEELKRNYNFRPDEIFKRMKISTFVQLVIQVADFDTSMSEVTDNPSPRSDRPDTADREVAKIQMSDGSSRETAENSPRDSAAPDSGRSRLEQVINGVGEVDLNAPSWRAKPLSMMGSSCPYLLLDVRDKDSYDECHIITAKSYPTAMLARSVNYETKDMLNYESFLIFFQYEFLNLLSYFHIHLSIKNQPGKIILVYDEDERISHRACTTLVQRGYDNLFMLSGGLKVAYKQFPEGLITGKIPASILQELQQTQKRTKSKEPPPVILENVDYFTPELIDKLVVQLDNISSDKSIGSRLSGTSKPSRSSSISSASTVSTMGRKPFKC
ncbi:unnamed protein product [Candidula unifasciata]|uniref:Rhodanese domain-containing protein n=1 Tax=Candidula unifasciata TaxID=100452 RepID=A0A8S3ZJU3_9EUPU|nr:unnamed protein product [Candidula unifasciata]